MLNEIKHKPHAYSASYSTQDLVGVITKKFQTRCPTTTYRFKVGGTVPPMGTLLLKKSNHDSAMILDSSKASDQKLESSLNSTLVK
jgi:hypothetical protein